MPPPLFEQLAEGGRMVMPVGEPDYPAVALDREGASGEMRVTEDSGCVFVQAHREIRVAGMMMRRRAVGCHREDGA